MQFGDLYVRFDRQVKCEATPKLTEIVTPVPVAEEIPPISAMAMAETQTQVAKNSLEMDEMTLKEEQLALAMIENPMLYEELLAKGDLEATDGQKA